MDQLKQNPSLALALFGLVLVISLAMMGIGALTTARKVRKKKAELVAREMAVMIEEVESTRGGNVCAALLVLTLLGCFLAFGAATTVFQQIEVGVVLIAGSVLFGLGIALGRTRTYRIYRSEHRQPM